MDSIVYDLNRHLTYRIARLQSRLGAQATEILKKNADISLSEWRILAILNDPHIDSQKDVLGAMGLDKGQVSRTMQRLENKGLIHFVSNAADQRQKQIKLTPSAHEIIRKIVPIMLKRQAHLQEHFSEKELNMLFDFISRLDDKAGPIEALNASSV